MAVTALCFRLLMILLWAQVQNGYTQKSDADFLHITPNRLQHFQFDSVSFDCGGFDGSSQLRVIRSSKGFKCRIKMMPQGSCTIERAYLGDSGEYWCETDGQEKSNRVNITVTAGSVILDSPILPVLEGNTVTLYCRHRTTIPNLQALFYKDDDLVQIIPAEKITIKNVTKSHEGLYKCSISDVGESPRSWLAVGANNISIIVPSPHEETLPDDSDSPHVFTLLWIAVLMMALVLLPVGFLHFRKHRVVFCFSSKTPTAESQSGEDGQIVSCDGSDPDGVTYAVVVTKQRKNKDSADAADNLSPETNHSRKPQRERDGDESSLQAVYSTLKTSETPQAPPLDA